MKYNLFKGYTVINGFGFTTRYYPYNIHDTLIVKCDGLSDCESPQYDIPYHTIDEYVAFIQKHKIQKAIIILNDISFIDKCLSIKFLSIIPSYQSSATFDFSPLYKMPEIKSLICMNRYGEREQNLSNIDYSRVQGLINLGISVNRGTLNFDKIETLRSLSVSDFKGKNRDLTDLFCSKELDTLSMIQCGIYSLNGIETSHNMQCLYLHYNRSLHDISALSKVSGTLKALRIENCPKIEDFSVLGTLENLELLELTGKNVVPNLDFIKTMKNLKTFTFNFTVEDGNLSPCMNLSYVYSEIDRKFYNLKDKELPKMQYVRGNEDIEEWRRLE